MPYQDGTGPFGNGRPGRGMGPCGRHLRNPNLEFGRGLRRRNRFAMRQCFGPGPMFWRNSEASPAVYEYEKDALEAQKSWLEKQLDWIKQRLQDRD